ncbi:hypothetical protein ACXR0M_06370 [Pseudomonas sp. Eth.TT006]
MLIPKLALTAAMVILSLPTHAAPLPNEVFEECKRTQNSAEKIMKARQAGVPRASLEELAEGAGDQYVSELYKILIEQAYQIPVYPSEAQQQQVTTDFQKNFFSACIVTAGKPKAS